MINLTMEKSSPRYKDQHLHVNHGFNHLGIYQELHTGSELCYLRLPYCCLLLDSSLTTVFRQ